MKNLRNVSLLVLAGMLTTGAIGIFAASQEWWTFASAALHATVLIGVVLILAGIRHTLRQILTLRQDFARELQRQRKWQDAADEKNSQTEKVLQTGMNRLRHGQSETEVVLEARINNLETQLQKVLDDRK